jgi:O-antigen ligase
MKILEKIINYGAALFVLLLPWQTRWIFKEASLNGDVWEYGRFSLYASEILLLALLALAAVRWLIYYLKLSRSQQIKETITEFKGLKFAVILLALWALATIFWAKDHLLAWYAWLKLAEGIGLFWLVKTQLAQAGRKLLIYSLVVSGVIQSIVGMSQWFWQAFPENKWLGLAGLNPGVLGTSVVEAGGLRYLRAYGAFPHPNILAGFLAVCLLTCLIFISKDSSAKLKFWLQSAAVMLTGGLFLTFSRAGWLAVTICVISYWLINYQSKAIKDFIRPSLYCLLVFLVFSLFNLNLITSRVVGNERLEIKSNTERLTSYQQVGTIIKSHWYRGVGLGNYTLSLFQKNYLLPGWAYQPAHNIYLLALSELGLIGLIIFGLLIFQAFKLKNQFWILLLAVLILGLFDHYFMTLFSGLMIWWLVLSLSQDPDMAG